MSDETKCPDAEGCEHVWKEVGAAEVMCERCGIECVCHETSSRNCAAHQNAEPEFGPDDTPQAPSSRSRLRDRNRRPREVRARTINVERITLRDRKLGQLLFPEEEIAANQAARPKTRGECIDGPRPCPFVGCRHHLYLDVSETTGSIKINMPDLEPWEVEQSCSLDVADEGRHTLEEVGALINTTRERVRQLVYGGDNCTPVLRKLRRLPVLRTVLDDLDEVRRPER